MDASASPRVDADLDEVYGFFLHIENSTLASPFKHKNTVIKYTKLPDFDFDSKGNTKLFDIFFYNCSKILDLSIEFK